MKRLWILLIPLLILFRPGEVRAAAPPNVVLILADDLGEKKNVAAGHPELVKELNARITRHLKDTDALVPIPNPAYDPEAAAGAWTGNRHAKLSREGGALVVTATGKDPFLTVRGLPKATGPYTLEFALAGEAKGNGQVFWSAGKERGFQRERSGTFPIPHDGKMRTYNIKIPPTAALRAVRLDPARGPGVVRIAWLKLKDGKGKTVREWDFADKE